MSFNRDKAIVFPFGRLAALIGGGISLCFYLTYLAYSSKIGRFCEIFATDCSAVIHSAYGSFGGMSTASLGLSYFIFHLSLVLGLKWIRTDAPDIIIFAAFLLSVVGLAFSLYFIYLLKLVLKQGCFACYGVHLINAVLFVQYLVQVARVRRLLTRQRLIAFFTESKTIAVGVFSLLVALNVVFGANFLEARYQLQSERKKLQENLQYYKYLYNISEYHEFEIEPADIVIGEKGLAIHQMVMLFKDNCAHCRLAKKKLSALAREYEMAVYLVLKNVKNFTPRQLERLNVAKTPAVFIDGKIAVGWDVPGFLDDFTRDCGC